MEVKLKGRELILLSSGWYEEEVLHLVIGTGGVAKFRSGSAAQCAGAVSFSRSDYDSCAHRSGKSGSASIRKESC